jgi:hypothetical protein
MQPKVERMQDEPAARDAEIRLVMLVVVPAERRHAVAALEPEVLERDRERTGSPAGVRVRHALERAVGQPGDDLLAAVVLLGAAQEHGQRQLHVHHEAVHAESPCRFARSSGPTRWPSRCT